MIWFWILEEMQTSSNDNDPSIINGKSNIIT